MLKVVDLAVLLDIQDFHLHQWMFILESPLQEASGADELQQPDSTENDFKPLCEQLAAGCSSNSSSSLVVLTKCSRSESHIEQKRRPIINVREVKNSEELGRLANALNHRGLLDSIECSGIDEQCVTQYVKI